MILHTVYIIFYAFLDIMNFFLYFLAPLSERQRSFSNAELSVIHLSVHPSIKIEGEGGGGVEGSMSETLQ